MTESKSDCYFFIVNPRAGSGKTMYEWLPAERRLKRLGIPCDIAMTDHKRHATALAQHAAAEGYRRIIAVGGDGSLHEVFNGICREYLTETDGKLNLGGICLMAGLGPESNRRRDGSFEYYISEPVVENDAKGTGPFVMAYTELLQLKKA